MTTFLSLPDDILEIIIQNIPATNRVCHQLSRIYRSLRSSISIFVTNPALLPDLVEKLEHIRDLHLSTFSPELWDICCRKLLHLRSLEITTVQSYVSVGKSSLLHTTVTELKLGEASRGYRYEIAGPASLHWLVAQCPNLVALDMSVTPQAGTVFRTWSTSLQTVNIGWRRAETTLSVYVTLIKHLKRCVGLRNVSLDLEASDGPTADVAKAKELTFDFLFGCVSQLQLLRLALVLEGELDMSTLQFYNLEDVRWQDHDCSSLTDLDERELVSMDLLEKRNIINLTKFPLISPSSDLLPFLERFSRLESLILPPSSPFDIPPQPHLQKPTCTIGWLPHLPPLTLLTYLSIAYSLPSDIVLSQLQPFCACVNLRKIKLVCETLCLDGTDDLIFPSVQSVRLHATVVTMIGRFPTVFPNAQFKFVLAMTQSLAELSPLPIRLLNCGLEPLTDADSDLQFPHLRDFAVANVRNAAVLIAILYKCASLRSLRLQNVKLSPQLLRTLLHHVPLHHLTLKSCLAHPDSPDDSDFDWTDIVMKLGSSLRSLCVEESRSDLTSDQIQALNEAQKRLRVMQTQGPLQELRVVAVKASTSRIEYNALVIEVLADEFR